MLKLERGKFCVVRSPHQQQQPAQVSVQDVSVQTVEVPTYQDPEAPKPDPSTYMILSIRKVDGVTVKTVSDRKTGNVFILTE
jgi:hypothetical protein